MTVDVVGLGAWCDYVTEEEYRARRTGEEAVPQGPEQEPRPGLAPFDGDGIENFRRGASFDVHEFAVLADGRRLTLHRERGFSVSGPPDIWTHLTAAEVEADVHNTVLPDDEATQDDHPWEWLAELLVARGVQVLPEQLRTVPYTVELSRRLARRLQASSGRPGCG